MIPYRIVKVEELAKDDYEYIVQIANIGENYHPSVAIFHGERQIYDEKFHWTLQALTPTFYVCWFSLPCPISFVVSSASSTSAECAFEMALNGVLEFYGFCEKAKKEN